MLLEEEGNEGTSFEIKASQVEKSATDTTDTRSSGAVRLRREGGIVDSPAFFSILIAALVVTAFIVLLWKKMKSE
jgi:hypothetical protein